MKRYEELRAEILRLKRERWAKILASEPAGRASGRRPRDPEQERLLLMLDRARLAEREARGDILVRRLVPAADDGGGGDGDDGGGGHDDGGDAGGRTG